MKSDHDVVFIEFSKSRINFLKTSEKFDFIKDPDSAFYDSGGVRLLTESWANQNFGLMKSNHAVVFNEFYYKGRSFLKTSEKFDFIKNKYQGYIASEV